MSDSIVFSITTSPPPVQAVKPAQTVSTSETSFEDVLRAQTEVSLPGEKPQAERKPAVADHPTEAAKSDQTAIKEEPIGEIKPEKENKDKPKEDVKETEDPIQVPLAVVAAEVPTVPVINAPLIVDGTQPVGESEVQQVAPLITQTILPNTSTPVKELIVTSTQPDTGQGNPALVGTTNQQFEAALTEQMSQGTPQADAKSTQPLAGDQASKINMDAKTPTTQIVKEVIAPVSPDTSQPAQTNKAEQPIAQAKPVQDGKQVKQDNKPDSSSQDTESSQTQTKTSSVQTPSLQGSQVAHNELKSALEKEGISLQVEKTAPKQVQAPPGQTQIDAVTIAGKTIDTPQTTQIIEPARLAEAQTIDMIGQITRQLDKLQQSGRTTFRLQLSPQDLGQIDLKITSTQHGIGVTILAENGATSKLLETQVAQLRQSLMDAGVQISNLHVGTQSSQSNQSQTSQNFSHTQRQQYPNTAEQSAGQDPIVTHTGQTLVDYKI